MTWVLMCLFYHTALLCFESGIFEFLTKKKVVQFLVKAEFKCDADVGHMPVAP